MEGATHSPAVEGAGVPIRTIREKAQHSTLCYVQKKHKIRKMNPTVQYTVYTETTYSDFAESNQLRTLNVCTELK